MGGGHTGISGSSSSLFSCRKKHRPLNSSMAPTYFTTMLPTSRHLPTDRNQTSSVSLETQGTN